MCLCPCKLVTWAELFEKICKSRSLELLCLSWRISWHNGLVFFLTLYKLSEFHLVEQYDPFCIWGHFRWSSSIEEMRTLEFNLRSIGLMIRRPLGLDYWLNDLPQLNFQFYPKIYYPKMFRRANHFLDIWALSNHKIEKI